MDSESAPAGDAVRSAARLTAVRATELLDAVAEASFDRLTAMAQRLTGAPFAFLTVVDDERSYWMSRQGIAADGPHQDTLEGRSASTSSPAGNHWSSAT